MIDLTGPAKPICIELVNRLNDDLKSVNTMIVEPGLRLFALKLLHSLVQSVRTKGGYNAIKDNVSFDFYRVNWGGGVGGFFHKRNLKIPQCSISTRNFLFIDCTYRV